MGEFDPHRRQTLVFGPFLSSAGARRDVLRATGDLLRVPEHAVLAPTDRLFTVVADMEFPAVVPIRKEAIV